MSTWPDPRYSAAILAGGQSARMGCDKSKLTFRGELVVERVARALRAACGGNLYCVGGDPELARGLGAGYVADLYPGAGPLGGLISALEACDTPRLFLAACDLPLLREELVRALIEHARADSRAMAVIPVRDGKKEPLCAIYAREICSVARGAMSPEGHPPRRSGKGAGMTSLYASARVVTIDAGVLPYREGLAGANTPSELRQLEQLAIEIEDDEPEDDDVDDERTLLPAPAPKATRAPVSTQAARRLAARLGALPDEAMRRALVVESLLKMGARDGAEVLEALLTPDAPRRAATAAAAAACIAVLAGGEALPYALATELYEVASERGYDAVRRLLLRPGARREPGADELGPDPRIADRTLGERKSLARRADPDLIDRLLFDPDPAVLKNLLANPRVTEREVVRIAAHRPAAPHILRLVAVSARFGHRMGVRRALARNPYTPSEIAVNILAFLVDADLRAVRSDATLHSSVREAADAVLRARRGLRRR